MTIIFILLVLGLFLILAEAILPGGVVGAIGGILIAVSIFLSFQEFGLLWGMVYSVFALILGGGLGIGAFLYVMKKLALGPDEPAPGQPRNPQPQEIGMQGKALTILDPTGIIRLADKRRQARSEASAVEIPEGAAVEVVAVDSTFLVVRETPRKDPA